MIKVVPKKTNGKIAYWYHISTTVTGKEVVFYPQTNDEGFFRSSDEPDICRTCVAPTLEQCIISIPYSYYDCYNIYRTKNKIMAYEAYDVFDSNITEEHWLYRPIKFKCQGKIDLSKIKRKMPDESASIGNTEYSKETLQKWKKINPWKYVQNN